MMMTTSSGINPVPTNSPISVDMRSNSCRFNNASDNRDNIQQQLNSGSGMNVVNSGNKISVPDYMHRNTNSESQNTNVYFQQPLYQHLHEQNGCHRSQERIIKHVGKIDSPCDGVTNSMQEQRNVSENSYYCSNRCNRECEDSKNVLIDLVPQYREQHYEEHLISRYNQHQISSPTLPYARTENPTPTRQLRRNYPRFPAPQQSPSFVGNCGGHASSPEPSISPPGGVGTATDRSSSTGSCVSSLSEPVVTGKSKLTSYHRKKKILDLEDDEVNLGAFAQR